MSTISALTIAVAITYIIIIIIIIICLIIMLRIIIFTINLPSTSAGRVSKVCRAKFASCRGMGVSMLLRPISLLTLSLLTLLDSNFLGESPLDLGIPPL